MIRFVKKIPAVSLLAVFLSVFITATTAAHVVVTPNEVVTSARTTFAVSVPNEHDIPVVKVRLVIPEGLTSVRPFAKAGWNVEVTKTGEGENISATEITWTGGEVPVELKDDFLFSAKAPAAASELKWKAYETYADGTVVGWEQEPSEAEDNKPYSITKVVGETQVQADLKQAQAAAADADKAADRAFYFGVIGVVLGVVGIALSLRSKKS